MYIEKSPKIKLFKIIPQKDSTIDSYYYYCIHCSYKISKTSNFKNHLRAKHENEFKNFLKTAINRLIMKIH